MNQFDSNPHPKLLALGLLLSLLLQFESENHARSNLPIAHVLIPHLLSLAVNSMALGYSFHLRSFQRK